MLRKTIVISLLALFFGFGANAQKLIEYQSGMGARRADNPDVWILYKTVKATHEGMVLNSDSAHYDTKKNKKNDPDRLEMNKYCRFCRKHTAHKETR